MAPRPYKWHPSEMTSSFEWDPAKEAENLRKHGVSFREAQLAFLDPERVIARDVAHALSAQGIGAKDRRSMKRKGNYTDEPMGQLEVVEDILPSPNRLVLKEDGVKITISLSKHSVDFFKAHAARSKVSYQKMIRRLLDGYAAHYAARSEPRRPTARRATPNVKP